jgi:hypothetical protein
VTITRTAPIALLSISSRFNRPSWMDQAACRGYPTTWWFAKSTPHRAIRICRRCPVQRECLAYAVERADDLYGVWGGLGRNERLTLRNTPASELGSQTNDMRHAAHTSR